MPGDPVWRRNVYLNLNAPIAVETCVGEGATGIQTRGYECWKTVTEGQLKVTPPQKLIL